jgi:hypothetical protein
MHERRNLTRNLTLEARYLSEEIAQQLRVGATAKEDAKRDTFLP